MGSFRILHIWSLNSAAVSWLEKIGLTSGYLWHHNILFSTIFFQYFVLRGGPMGSSKNLSSAE